MPTAAAIANFRRASRVERGLRVHERGDRASLEAHQASALSALVAHACTNSPYYSRLYASHGVDERTPLTGLPPVDKADLVANFDEWVTDSRVTFDAARENLDGGARELLAGEFAVMSSGGSSRTPGLFVFSRAEWSVVAAITLRMSRWEGVAPRVPRMRMAMVQASGPQHMAARVSAGFDFGVHRVLRLDASSPRSELVAALNGFQPHVLVGYASVVAALASDQLDGGLRIAPEIVSTTSEPRSPAMGDRIRTAWSREPFDVYATTETAPVATDCPAHSGLHVMEDVAIVEVVDAEDNPVADGELGDHVLVTNLFNRTQPFIRHRLTDMTAYELGDCRCGMPFRRLRAVDGRTDDILSLPGSMGGTIAVHPTAFSPLFSLPGVAELELVQRGGRLEVGVVASGTAANGNAAESVTERLRAILAEQRCGDVAVTVTQVERLERDARSGKIKLVRREL